MRDHSRSGHCVRKVDQKRGLPSYRTPSSFQAKVFEVVKEIPRGKTMTYKQVAHRIGNPGSYRAVGNALNKNCDPNIPCHRVVRSNGKIGGFNKGSAQKEKLLKQERAI